MKECLTRKIAKRLLFDRDGKKIGFTRGVKLRNHLNVEIQSTTTLRALQVDIKTGA